VLDDRCPAEIRLKGAPLLFDLELTTIARLSRVGGQILEAAYVRCSSGPRRPRCDAAGSGAAGGIWTSIVSLGLFALLAVRRTAVAWWQRTLVVVALVGLGALVVLLKTLGH
jgi:hypothetical protein